jgi:hypothetical protein
MPLLINLKTNLKSLKYGGDRPGKGNSGQPFIQSKIPDSSFLGTISGPDSIFRGGISGAAKSSIIDVNRLKLWFQQPVNSLFIDKQNLLSRTAAPAQGGTKQAPKLLNEGVYTPLSTLAQAGVISIGGHLNKQGINPFTGIGLPYTPSLYLDKVKESNQINNYKDNRLYNLYETHITKKNISPSIISYSGGPGSILGVGKTNIKFADQRTGKNNAKNINGNKTWTPSYSTSDDILDYRDLTDFSNSETGGVAGKWNFLTNGSLSSFNFSPPSVYKLGNNNKPTLLKNDDKILYANGSITYNQTQIISQSAQSKDSFGSPSLQDFRTNLLKQTDAGRIMSAAPDYKAINIDSLSYIGMDSAGKKGNKKSYTNGKNEDIKNVIDKITSEGISEGMDGTDFKDLCKFNIGFLNAGNKSIQFRAYLDNISDNYNPNWNSFKYPGRADSFYTYEGFDRKLTLGWSIVALSKGELEPMYKKLNYLASATTAEYSQYGYMKGVLTQLTIGNYIKELPGFINSLTYDISTDTTWEIGIDDTGSFSGKQLPHMIKVTMGYTPIPTQVARFEVNPTSTPRFVNMQ